MPRLGYETPCRPVRGPAERDRFLAVVKLATFAVAVGLIGGLYLLSGGTSEEAGRPAAAVRQLPTTSSTPVVVAPPVVSTATSEVVPAPPASAAPPPPATTTAAPPPAPAPPREDPRFAVVGEECPRDGMYSVTSRYRPVRCERGAWQLIRMGE